MSDTRRDFLRFAAAGASSLAAIGLGTDLAQACCWWSSSAPSRSQDQFRELSRLAPTIDFQTPTSNSDIARSFTVYGSYQFVGMPNIECKLWKAGIPDTLGVITHSGSPGSSSGTWMADFMVPNPPADGTTGLTLTAKLIGTLAQHDALNLRLTSPPVTIGNAGNMIVKAKIKKHAKPEGMVNDSKITSVWVTYFHEGSPLHAPHKAELIPAQGAVRRWRVRGGGHIDLTPHANKTKVALVVEAFIEPVSGPIKRFLVSDHTNTIES